MTYTFAVDDVSLAEILLHEVNYSQAIEERLGGPVEACAWQHRPLVGVGFNGFVAAVHEAYQDHRPLILSPDHVWLVLCQGLADHIKLNAKALRHHFVQHKGKEKLCVERRDFQKNNPLNPWDEVIAEWIMLMKDHIGDQHDLITAVFSTTGPIETTAFQIAMMDAMQQYFEYEARCACGIPSITLEGTPSDWRQIHARIQRFRPLGLDWWVDALEGVTQEFVNASEGQINLDFWQAFYKDRESYVTWLVSGHLLKLFPYSWDKDKKPVRNEYVTRDAGYEEGLWTSQFPDGLSAAPFKFTHEAGMTQMEVLAGFVGLSQNAETKAVRPEIGWAVRDLDALNTYNVDGFRRYLESFGMSLEEFENLGKDDSNAE